MIYAVLAAVFIIITVFLVLKVYLPKVVDRQIADYQNDLFEIHWREVENMYRQTRGWRHDYHNHIQSMKVFLEMGRLTELAQYLDDLDKDLTTVDTVIKTGNTKVDAALNSKISLAKKNGIKVTAKAIVPSELSISEVDLSLLIGNLLDNAMEACIKITEEEERFIRVHLDVIKGQFYLYVMNSVGENLKKSRNTYLSTKSGEHGFGLMRVDKVVEKYHGYINRQDETDVFVTEIMLPLL